MKVLHRFFDNQADKCSKDLYQSLDFKFDLKQFGSSVFGGADKNSDIDLLLISFDDLLSREAFIT